MRDFEGWIVFEVFFDMPVLNGKRSTFPKAIFEGFSFR